MPDTKDDTAPVDKPARPRPDPGEDRRAAALRANLKRRKQTPPDAR